MIEKATTHGVQVEVESRFIAEQSDISQNRFLFAYLIRITNTTDTVVQLINRQWKITDGLGRIEIVEGPGVVGQQPRIEPGESFEYESFCPLTTPTGTMSGHYEMVWSSRNSNMNLTGSTNVDSFLAEIPQFFLVEPGSFH